jgi:hypothetical protein
MKNGFMFFNIISTELNRLNIEIQKLEDNLKITSEKLDETYIEQLKELKKKKEAVDSKLKAVRVSGKNVADDIKKGIEYGIEDLRKAIKNMASKI